MGSPRTRRSERSRGSGRNEPVLDTLTVTQLKESLTVEMRERLLATFQESLPQCVSEIAEAMERGDRAEVRRVAHKLKGSSATLGATRLGAACLALERTRDDDPVPGGAEIERLRELAEEARGALQVQLL